jgi:hypothetical protein
MAYLTERQREAEYNEALRRINPAMTHSAMNAAQAAMWNSAITTGTGMGAINQAWAPQTTSHPYEPNTRQFAVEKVDNGFIIRSGKYSKVCKDMTELSEQFVAIMVEAQLDK